MMLTVTADEIEDMTTGVTIPLYRIFRFPLFELSRILFSLFFLFLSFVFLSFALFSGALSPFSIGSRAFVLELIPVCGKGKNSVDRLLRDRAQKSACLHLCLSLSAR